MTRFKYRDKGAYFNKMLHLVSGFLVCHSDGSKGNQGNQSKQASLTEAMFLYNTPWRRPLQMAHKL